MKVCVFDLDGTLLSSDKEILKSSLEAIDLLRKHDYHITIATGRSYQMVKKYSKQLGISLPIVLCNGGMIYDNKTFSRLLPLPDKAVKEIICYAKATNHFLHVYDKDHIYSEIKDHKIMDVEGELISVGDESKLKIVDRLEDLKDKIYKILIPFKSQSDKEDLIKRYRSVEGIALFPSGGALEVVHKDASKGNGVKFLCESLNIGPENLIVFGDQDNDISMFEYAHTSIAMGNCINHLKDYATYVTSTNDDHGISKAVHKWLL
ncbi:HAD family phosphatase [Acidaminobacter sp. JC074]|uniref:Cof-type HAD-IIB family hydrolase n=1 Tax=Acidaminobacter sp. JC074 TaxID=2530199 RepID=UPI001F1053F6|nr:Cof-type HAD-IIB family hydrolase [Acidaminobacter sp. JC074]MCH4886448.1 HAD family phosphatase [Acidaminobacter sp. JC074]